MSDSPSVPDAPVKTVVASVLYRTGQAPLDVPIEQLDVQAVSPGELLWIGLKEPDADLLKQVGGKLGLGRRAIEEIIEPHRRPKVMEFRNMTLIVVATVEIR